MDLFLQKYLIKRDNNNFDIIVNFPFLDGDVPNHSSYGVYTFRNILGLLESAIMLRTSTRNKCLTAKLFQQGYRYHKLRKTFSKFHRIHYELISKFKDAST